MIYIFVIIVLSFFICNYLLHSFVQYYLLVVVLLLFLVFEEVLCLELGFAHLSDVAVVFICYAAARFGVLVQILPKVAELSLLGVGFASFDAWAL